MERLDRLAPVKETAQVAAAIGREFSYRLLKAISPIQGAELQDALAQLMAADLIHGRGGPPDATYVFKHALVQDTAHFCGAVASASMPTSHGRWRRSSPIRSQRRLRPSRVTALRPGSPIRRCAIGWRRANWRSRARPTRKPIDTLTLVWP
jgi:hypothetical protein